MTPPSSFTVHLVDAQGERMMDEASFPLALGGEDSVIELSGDVPTRPAAWIGLSEGDVFVQGSEIRDEAGEAAELALNGRRVLSSEWLQDGDLLRLGDTRIEVALSEARLVLRVRGVEPESSSGPRLTPPVGPPPPRPPSSGRPRDASSRSGRDTAAVIEPVEFRPRAARRSDRARQTGRRVRRGVLALALASVSLVAWWILTARSVAIEIDPLPDLLTLERVPDGGGWALPLAGRWVLRPGSYRIVAEKTGYRRLEVPIEVGGEHPDSFELTLEPLPGLIAIDVGGLAGATVRVNGEEVGETPLEPLELAAGRYEIEVEAPGHFAWSTDLEVEGFGQSQTVAVELASRLGLVRVDSSPQGASVWVDGREVGATPLEVPLLSGAHRVELRRPGYLPARRRIDVEAEKSAELALVSLTPAPGRLEVTSVPPGANVTVNDRFEGETPLTVEVPPGETQTVELTLDGYLPAERAVGVRAGEREGLEFVLEPEVGQLTVEVVPESAELYVDGENRGPANQTLELSAAREHRVEIRLDGYESHVQSVNPRPDFAQRIEVRLRSLEEARVASILPVIQTSQGQELRLIDGGTFQMGASRREPGRRANESLREVQIQRRFYLATEEVSNAEFREFRSGHRSGAASSYSLDVDSHPVVEVSWEDAALYCNWLSEKDGLTPVYERRDGVLVSKSPIPDGYRLPTEAEWAWVARYGGRSGEGRKYPWGQGLPVPPGSENYGDSSAAAFLGDTVDGYSDGSPASAPVDSFEADAAGFYNLGGNVAEWMHDLYAIYSPTGAAEVDPTGPSEGELHVIRGASWRHATITELRLSFRDYGKDPRSDLGFRVARYLE